GQDRAELVLLAREVVVAALLEAPASVPDVGEAHRMSKRRSGRIGACVNAVLTAAVADAARELRPPVRGVDHAARDLLLLDQRAPVVGVVLERARLEDSPARG